MPGNKPSEQKSGRGGRGRGRNKYNQGRGGCGSQSRASTKSPGQAKFKGNCPELSGYIFDCSDYKQADNYQTTIRRIAEYIGSEYKHGGDIRSTVENEKMFVLIVPTYPENEETKTEPSELNKMMFKGELGSYLKRKSILEENCQRSYSLILGQCTDLLKSKLKQSEHWDAMSTNFDVLALIKAIKAITFKFEDQKYLPLSLHNAKAAFYRCSQGDKSNEDYLQKFNNTVDIATAFNGTIYDQAIVDFATDKAHPGKNYQQLTDTEKLLMHAHAKEICLATAFICQSDGRRYGRLKEELENDKTKGNDNYPANMVSVYQLLNKYTHYMPRAYVPEE